MTVLTLEQAFLESSLFLFDELFKNSICLTDQIQWINVLKMKALVDLKCLHP